MSYTTMPAPYSKGNFVVRPTDSCDSYKGRASYLCEALNMRWVHRSQGYTASPSKLRRFEHLHASGWSATLFGELVPPRT
jgi:hypothetical protein